MEVLWVDNPTESFLDNLRAFAESLDWYKISWNVEPAEQGKFLEIREGGYSVSDKETPSCFKCPKCHARRFSILEGEFASKPAIGLACEACETYGSVYPCGL